MFERLRKEAKRKMDEFFGIRPSWCPEGFMPCDGRSFSKSKYAYLFKAIGDAYGDNVPNLAPEPDPYIKRELAVPVICTTGRVPGMVIYVAVKSEEYERTA